MSESISPIRSVPEVPPHMQGASLGKGGYGEVRAGTLGGVPIAVKHVALKTEIERLAVPSDPEETAALPTEHLPTVRELARALLMPSQEAAYQTEAAHSNVVPLVFNGLNATRTGYEFGMPQYAGTLEERINGSDYTLAEAVRWISDIASALGHMHGRGLIHRDVKPNNILLDISGRAMLADFGIATTLAPPPEGHGAVGTPSYSAPEQAHGKPVAASDQYALAVTAYWLFTRETPFDGDELQQLQAHHNTPAPSFAKKLGIAAIPKELYAVEKVVLKGLAKDPAQRFLSVTEFAEALQDAACPLLPEEEQRRFFPEFLRREAARYIHRAEELYRTDPNNSTTPLRTLAWLDQAVGKDPENILAWHLRASVLRKSGKPEEARRTMSVIRQLPERTPQDFAIKGYECSVNGEYAEALQWFREAMAKNCNMPMLDVWMARARKFLGDTALPFQRQ